MKFKNQNFFMNQSIGKRLASLRQHRRKLAVILVCLSVLTAGGTTWSLHMTGESQVRQTWCGKEEHQHDSSCNKEKVLICPYAQDEDDQDNDLAKTDSSWQTAETLICTKAEHEHSEDDGCFDEQGNLICEKDEHVHSLENGCYDESLEDEISESDVSDSQMAAASEHVHTDSCYEIRYDCGFEAEHVHTLSCYSNPDADIETAADWEQTVENVQLTGNFAQDLIAIAKTQLGYAESYENYEVVLDDDGNETEQIQGYTRYGDWYGDTYASWDAMFVSFCLNYASITEEMIPYSDTGDCWIESLKEKDFYQLNLVQMSEENGKPVFESSDYLPESGDLIFFDEDGQGESIRVGIVEKLEIKEKSDEDGILTDKYVIHTIEGDSLDTVAKREYALENENILGYASLHSVYVSAVDNDLIENVRHLSATAEDGAVISAIGEIPEKAELSVTLLGEEQKAYIKENFGLTGCFYDIKIMLDGKEYQPDKTIQISVSGLNFDAKESLTGYHLADVSADRLTEVDAADVNVETVDIENTGNRIDFGADGFSVYGISTTALDDEVSTAAAGDETCSIFKQLEEIDITQLGGKTFAITSFSGKHAMTDTTASGGGLVGGPQNSISTDDVIWTFEAVNASSGRYRIKNASNQYLVIRNGTLSLTPTVGNDTIFTISNPSGDTSHILIHGSTTYINAFGGEGNFSKFSVYNTTNQGSQMRLYYLEQLEFNVVTDTVSPSSTIINLFDYWLDERDTSDYQDGNAHINSGIDANHALKFCLGNIGNSGGINYWTRSAAPRTGIVKETLVEGYPFLNSGLSYNSNNVLSEEESLAYLFDPTIEHNGKASYTDVQNLLTVDKDGYFYYNSTERYAYYDQGSNSFTEYSLPAVNGNSGYGQFFPFNTLEQAVGKHSTGEGINHYFGVSLIARFIQDHEGYTDSTRQRATTFEFSGDDDVWIFIDDVLVADLGGIHDAASVTIDFATGEVTINDGEPETLKKKFTDAGVAWTNGTSNTFADNSTHTLKFFYLERGNVDSNMMLKYNLTEIPATSVFKVDQYGEDVTGATFAFYPAYVDNNNGTETWYYAQNANETSGGVSANDLNAQNISYDDDWNITYNDSTIPARYYGSTDNNGRMIFVDQDGMPLSLEEIQDKLGLGSHFIMREVKVPEGYRTVSDEAFLYVANDTTLMCSDPYGTGVWISPDVKITATNTLYVAETSKNLASSLTSEYLSGNATDGYTINYYTPDQGSHGTLFAVVLKRNNEAPDATNWDDLNIPAWYPLYGSDETGYIVSDQNDLAASIAVAKAQAEISNNVFTEQASGMQLTYTNLPGDPTRYYSYMRKNNVAVTATDPQYLIAYYWTTADSLDDATTSNTLRISSHNETTPENASGFDDLWGATIEVPNVINALYFQKADTDGDLVDNAEFALYHAEISTDGKGFYTLGSGDNTVYIRLDEDNGTQKNGAATVYSSMTDAIGTVGTYSIQSGSTQNNGYITDAGAGTITVKAGDQTWTILPAVNAPAGGSASLVGYTHDSCTYVTNEAGTGHFHYIEKGTYFLKEVTSPTGYSMNYANIPVEVTDEGVYANAGTADNNVRVGNGAGYLVKTLDVFASLNNIDETLSWIKAHLKVKNGTADFLNQIDNVFYTFGYLSNDYEFDGYGISNGQRTSYIPAGALTNGTGDGALTSGTNTSNAMTQYLQYEGSLTNGTDENKVFDYALYARESSFPAGVQAYRLWTESGWSDLAIFQDTAYGQARNTTGSTTNYTALPNEISYLFSSSTFVQVTDKVDVDLTVTKMTNDFDVKDGENISSATVYLDGAEFYLKNSANQYYKYDETTDMTSWVSKEDATKLTTETYFKATGETEYTKIKTSVSVENGIYAKIYTINETDYTLSSYDNGSATFIPVSGTGNLMGTLRRSYFKVYNLTEGTYSLIEEITPTYSYTVGGATTTESFNLIDSIPIEIKSGNYYYYISGVTGNRIIVPSADLTMEPQTDGTQIPKSFTYRDAEGNVYLNVPLTPNAAGNEFTYSFYPDGDESQALITGTLYQTTGNGFTLEADSPWATRVFRVDNTGTTAPYYETTDAYQAGFRVLNTTEVSDQSITLVKADESAIGSSTLTSAGYNDDQTTFTISEGSSSSTSYSTHNILTGAQFYLYYKTVEEGVETPYYYGYAEDGTTVQWNTELSDAQKFSVDDSGSLTFTSLNANNTYYLTETQAPDGYNLLTSDIQISWLGDPSDLVVNGASVQTVTETTGTGENSSSVDKKYIVIFNSSGYELPNAGGSGTYAYTLGGLALMAAAAVYGLLVSRSERRTQ